MKKEISAGGVVYRQVGENAEVLLIHDRFGKITLPKGHQEAGESIEQTALREIEEETGVSGEIVHKINTISYVFTHPQYGEVEKKVTYYVVKTNADRITPQLEEINGVEWYTLDEAKKHHQINGYDNNQSILEEAILYISRAGLN